MCEKVTNRLGVFGVMNKREAQAILREQLARFTSYAELVPLVRTNHVECVEVFGTSGTKYQVEIQFFWDDKAGESVRMFGSVDDAGVRAFCPLTETRVISPPEGLYAASA